MITRRGTSEGIEVRWPGGRVTRHEVIQGLQSDDHLGGFGELKGCVTGLRREGRTGEQIAEVLNRDGYRPPPITGTESVGYSGGSAWPACLPVSTT